jgi:hypothetical protein
VAGKMPKQGMGTLTDLHPPLEGEGRVASQDANRGGVAT